MSARREERPPSDLPVRRTRGLGPFVTFVEYERPDGALAHWESRRARKHQARAKGSTWFAPTARGWWIGILFAIGSFCFALGAVPGYASAAGTKADSLTFFVGSLFFTSAAFLQYREAVDAGRGPADDGSSSSGPARSTGWQQRSNCSARCGST